MFCAAMLYVLMLCTALPLASCAREGDAQAAPAAQAPGPFRAVVDHVDDGDTLSVRAGGQVFRIRLAGVDAPEFGQRFGLEARNRLRALVFDRQVEVRATGVDQYGRLLACPVVDAQNVCETMVAEGWAWQYRQYSNDQGLAALEAQARAARRGLWSDPDARPPWERRAEERQRAGGGAAAGGAAAGSAPQSPHPAAVGAFHGNVKSRVFHAAGCPEYNCAGCTAVFPTREAAEASGYRPHRECVRWP